jgi:hypothetical protein
LLRKGESTPRRNESATTTLSPPESGDINCPGIMRDIEFLAGVVDLSGCGEAGPCWAIEWECTSAWREDLGVDGFVGSRGDTCASVGRAGDEFVPWMPNGLVAGVSSVESIQGLLRSGVSSVLDD